MKIISTFILIAVTLFVCRAQVTITQVGVLPTQVSNNAVCEGFVEGVPYIYSFGGIDSTKKYSGIHLHSYRFNIETGIAEQIADLPDNLGKIAAAASRIDNIIYISGGYNVHANGSETSNKKMHRYDINNNVFLDDGSDIPIAIDDHVQVVYKDSLIYIITGWSNVANVRNVQIYNPSLDEWTIGSSVPNNNNYKSFGAAGTIIGDTIYYFGGATSGAGFGIQNQLRKGVINSENPSEIDWSISTPDSSIKGYRMAATVINNQPHWIGGSTKSYNFNGIAYDGSGGVALSNRDLYFDLDYSLWKENNLAGIPMDLRGIASINDTIKYTAGGMIDGQQVTNKVFRIEWNNLTSIENIEIADLLVFPNPVKNQISIESKNSNIKIDSITCYDQSGHLIVELIIDNNKTIINSSEWTPGVYFVIILIDGKKVTHKVIKE
ncbi:MAG: T9SS type A sorting domain-containing protein [Saprospiraceae bacterium]